MKETAIENRIEHSCISSNVVYPNFVKEDAEFRLVCIVDAMYLRSALRKTGVASPSYISNKYLVELDTYQGKQLFYQMDADTWFVQRNY